MKNVILGSVALRVHLIDLFATGGAASAPETVGREAMFLEGLFVSVASGARAFAGELTPVGAVTLAAFSLLNGGSLLFAYTLSERSGKYIDGLQLKIDSLNISGRNPQKCKSIQKQIWQIECRRKNIIEAFWQLLKLFFVFGFVVQFFCFF